MVRSKNMSITIIYSSALITRWNVIFLLLLFLLLLSLPPLPESPTVMLAAGSFSSPYEHLSQSETKRMVEHYTADRKSTRLNSSH